MTPLFSQQMNVFQVSAIFPIEGKAGLYSYGILPGIIRELNQNIEQFNEYIKTGCEKDLIDSQRKLRNSGHHLRECMQNIDLRDEIPSEREREKIKAFARFLKESVIALRQCSHFQDIYCEVEALHIFIEQASSSLEKKGRSPTTLTEEEKWLQFLVRLFDEVKKGAPQGFPSSLTLEERVDQMKEVLRCFNKNGREGLVGPFKQSVLSINNAIEDLTFFCPSIQQVKTLEQLALFLQTASAHWKSLGSLDDDLITMSEQLGEFILRNCNSLLSLELNSLRVLTDQERLLEPLACLLETARTKRVYKSRIQELYPAISPITLAYLCDFPSSS